MKQPSIRHVHMDVHHRHQKWACNPCKIHIGDISHVLSHKLIYPSVIKHSNGKSHVNGGFNGRNGGFSIAMFDYWRVDDRCGKPKIIRTGSHKLSTPLNVSYPVVINGVFVCVCQNALGKESLRDNL